MRSGFLAVIICLSFQAIVSAEQLFVFEGNVDFRQQEMKVKVDISPEETINAVLKKSKDRKYYLKFDLNHVNFYDYDLSTEIESIFEFKETTHLLPEVLVGKVWSNYSVVDFKPVKELSGTFKVGNNHLVLNDISFGSLDCSGYIDLEAPHKLDLSLAVNLMEMKDFLKFWMRNKDYDSAGQVAGIIRATGSMDRLNLKGNLESYDGFIKDLTFDSLVLNIEGVYPDLLIDKSSNLSRGDGVSFTFDGPINFEDRTNFKRQLKSLNFSPLVKESSSQKKWTIKRHKEGGSNSAELKYFIRKEGDGSQNDDESALFGIERSLEF